MANAIIYLEITKISIIILSVDGILLSWGMAQGPVWFREMEVLSIFQDNPMYLGLCTVHGR